MATCHFCGKRIGRKGPACQTKAYYLPENKGKLCGQSIYTCEDCRPAFHRWLNTRDRLLGGQLLMRDSPIFAALLRINYDHGYGTVIDMHSNPPFGTAVRALDYGNNAASAVCETRRFRFDGKTVFFLGHQQKIA